MNESTRLHNEARLKEECPVFFRDLHNCTMQQSCMYWGIAVRDEWFPIVEEAAKKIEALNQGIVCSQIKEKFGMLTIYTEGTSKEVEEILGAAYRKAAQTKQTIKGVRGLDED